MCGFVAVIAKDTSSCKPIIDVDILEKMTSLIQHRGPDDSGFYTVHNWLALGFRRLSINDLSDLGHQPMLSIDGRYIIVFNGEIYNFIEIRASLEKLGYQFKSHTDTEVILAAYQQWGSSCVSQFVGMFSFILVDIKYRSVFYSRDSLGIKPLFLYEDSERYIFVSEVKSLLPFTQLVPDLTSLNEYLIFRSVLGAATLYKDVSQILPGYYGYINSKGNKLEKYFHFQSLLTSALDTNFESICDDVHSELKRSIGLHLRGDVEIGIQLSGGVDSSLIAAIAAQITGKNLHTYSISFNENIYDESKYQDYVSSKYNTQHHRYQFTEEHFLSYYKKSIWHFEHPLADPNIVPTYYLNEKANNDIKVMLSGEGADEAFMGYSRFKPHVILALQRKQRLFNNPLFRKLILRFWPLTKGKRFIQQSKYNPILFNLSYADFEDIDGLLCDSKLIAMYREGVLADSGSSFIDKVSLQDQMCDLEQWFWRADRIGMAASIEQRVPFSSVPLFRIANSIPYKYKVYNGERKAVLKKISEEYFESDLIYRKKIGFGVPLDHWSKNKNGLGELIANTFESQNFRTREFINHRHADIIVRRWKKTGQWERSPSFLWTYLNLEAWYSMFFEGGWKDFVSK